MQTPFLYLEGIDGDALNHVFQTRLGNLDRRGSLS